LKIDTNTEYFPHEDSKNNQEIKKLKSVESKTKSVIGIELDE